MQKKVLLTTVCRPFGPEYGDAPSVGYELLYRQVTRAQGLFSPRALHLTFSLDYIAENLSAPATVLQYPSKRELIAELKKGYDFVGVSFMMALFRHMKEAVELIRRYAPESKIVLGGYGTILSDEALAPYSDFICREEGVAFFRRLLEEPPLPLPYRHPLIVSRMKIFSLPVSRTGMVFAGLGCPNGCDFCCTSHFFKRKHVKLLPTGRDIYDVIQRYLEIDPKMPFVVLDEDFLLNRKRAMELREAVLAGGKAVSLFVFSSIRAISQYSVQEILEMGIDGFWIGYEGTRSGYAKQQGRPAAEIFREFREHGITILSSMVVGFDYQDESVVREELEGLLSLHPTLAQFLIYGPTPGTPFYERIMAEKRLRDDLAADPEKYYNACDGFSAMVKHPALPAEAIERMQRACFKEDFERLGPSIYRALETWFLGYQKLKDSPVPFLRKKAELFAREIRKAYPVFLAGTLLGPNPNVRGWVERLRAEIHAELGRPTLKERALALLSLAAALWTGLTLKANLFQHPSLVKRDYRFPHLGLFHRHWWRSAGAGGEEGLHARVEHHPKLDLIWVRLEGAMDSLNAEELGVRLRHTLQQSREKVILDLKKMKSFEERGLRVLYERLSRYRSRVQVVLPSAPHIALPDWFRFSRALQPLPSVAERSLGGAPLP